MTMRIPNVVSLALVAGFLLLAPATGVSWQAIGIQFGFAISVLVAGFIMFYRGYMGGGDAKLLAAGALWFGAQDVLPFLLISSLYGGALTLGLLYVRTLPLPASIARIDWAARLHHADVGIPYGIAITAGALTVYPMTHWMAAL